MTEAHPATTREPIDLDEVQTRIGILDKDLLNDPDVIFENASHIAGWYVHDCDRLVAELRAARGVVERVRAHQTGDMVPCVRCAEALANYDQAMEGGGQ